MRRRVVRKAPVKSIQGRSGQVTFSSAYHKHTASAAMRGHKLMVPPQIYSLSSSGSISAGPGVQSYFNRTNLSQQTLRAIMNQVKAASGTGGANAGICRAVIRGVTEEFLYSNSTNASMELDLYDIILKRDLPATLSFNANIYTYTATPDPANYIAVGLLAQQGADPATPPFPEPYTCLSAQPSDSRLFNDYFKITRKTRVFMAPGATHKHVVNINTNRIVDEVLASATISGRAGFTTYTMALVRGMPVAVNDSDPTTNSLSLLCVNSQRVKYSWISDTTYGSIFGTALNSVASSASQAFVNPLDGQVDNVQGLPPLS